MKTREEILANLKMSELEEGRTGLVDAFPASEIKDEQPGSKIAKKGKQ